MTGAFCAYPSEAMSEAIFASSPGMRRCCGHLEVHFQHLTQAEAFTGAHAEEANRLLETPHLNGWTM